MAADARGLPVSRRPVRPVPHLEGTFPESIEALWCVTVAGEHVVVTPEDHHVALGGMLRPLVWTDRDWAVGHMGAERYFQVLTHADGAHIHDTVAASEGTAPAHAVPARLTATLYPYQADGYSRMRRAVEAGVGVMLFDEMGLGKTVQAIAVMASRPVGGQHLVVCPGSLLANWERELGQFAPSLSVQRQIGPFRAGVRSSLTGDVVLTSYETAVNDLALLSRVDWDLLVLDEAQRIKNPEAQRSITVKSIPRQATICITGTPVENTLVDLWSLADATLPGLLGDRADFERNFPDEFSCAQALGQVTAPVTVRRLVADVANDLPPRIDSLVPLDMPDEMASQHRAIEASCPALEAITKCRILTAHAAEGPRNPRGGGKLELVSSMLENILPRGEKVLIFASFQLSLDQLGELVATTQPDAWVRVMDGRTPPATRQELVDEFSEFLGGAVLVMNPQAAGVGLNIVAANHVIHFNPEWNPAVTAQATARSHRRRQTKTVFVHHLYYRDSIEQRALDRSSFKGDLARQVATGTIAEENG